MLGITCDNPAWTHASTAAGLEGGRKGRRERGGRKGGQAYLEHGRGSDPCVGPYVHCCQVSKDVRAELHQLAPKMLLCVTRERGGRKLVACGFHGQLFEEVEKVFLWYPVGGEEVDALR